MLLSILIVSLGTQRPKAKSYILGAKLKLRTSKTVSVVDYPYFSRIDGLANAVTDRLAYLNFVQGSLSNSLALKLDTARAQLKYLRDTETAITPRRNIRAGLSSQIARIEHEQQKGYERRLEDLKAQLKKHEDEDSDQEKQIQILKRKAIKESEQKKWDAIREVGFLISSRLNQTGCASQYGEKLVLLAQAAAPITAALPIIPPNPGEYKGAPATAAARASLQRALDNYKTGHINLTPLSDLSRSDTQSFGESHKSELLSMTSEPGIPLTPPAKQAMLPPETTSSAPSQSPPPALNNALTALPTTSSSPPVALDTAVRGSTLPGITPTVAETGIPVYSGENGPGPASGSLHDIKAASPTAGPKSGGLAGNVWSEVGYGQSPADTPAKFESAEEEKKRLQREDRERLLAAQGSAPAPSDVSTSQPSYESAEEEKKRLEREEREKLFGQSSSGGDGDELPAYQEM